MERQLTEALQNLVNAIKNNQEFLSLPMPEIMKAYSEAEDLLNSESCIKSLNTSTLAPAIS